MILKFFRKHGVREQAADLAWSAGAPLLRTTVSEIGSGTGMGTPCSLVRLEVYGSNGRVSSAYVGARLNGRDQVQFEISAGRGKGVRKALVAHWRPAQESVDVPDAGEAREALARDVIARIEALAGEYGIARENVLSELIGDLCVLEGDHSLADFRGEGGV